ncbi:MAG: hypothetical protein IT289_04135 [Oligoflexia bacterium]|nr:hypothetical protein [Oligoflexia bacterium]
MKRLTILSIVLMLAAFAILKLSGSLISRVQEAPRTENVRAQMENDRVATVETDAKLLPKQNKWDAENYAKWQAFLKLQRPSNTYGVPLNQVALAQKARINEVNAKKKAQSAEAKRRKKRKKRLEELAKKSQPTLQVSILEDHRRPMTTQDIYPVSGAVQIAGPLAPKSKLPLAPQSSQPKFELNRLIQRLLSAPTKTDLQALIKAFQLGTISQGQYEQALLVMIRGPVAMTRRMAIQGADIIKSLVAFSVLSQGTLDNDSVNQNEAQSKLADYQNIYQLPILNQALTSGELIGKIRAAESLELTAQSYVTSPETTAEQRIAFEPFVEILKPMTLNDDSPELKDLASKALKTINQLIGGASAASGSAS